MAGSFFSCWEMDRILAEKSLKSGRFWDYLWGLIRDSFEAYSENSSLAKILFRSYSNDPRTILEDASNEVH